MNEALSALDLQPEVNVQTLKLLARIHQASNPDDLWRASNRAAGFVLGLETVKALDVASIKALYGVFDGAATARRLEEAQ